MIILVDLDGVVVDFNGGFLRTFRQIHPDAPYKLVEDFTEFYIRDNYPKEWREKIDSIYYSPGFYLTLRPIPGSVEALWKILRRGHTVRVCTTPLGPIFNANKNERELWILWYLGYEFFWEREIVEDKTMVGGDILIDDKPIVDGQMNPLWEHVVFDQPYNRHVGKRRINWSNYAEVLGI